jgi:hypothetical protein
MKGPRSRWTGIPRYPEHRQQLSGLKINFHKSKIFCFRETKYLEDEFRCIFGCEIGTFPFKYLEIPIHFRKLKNGEWKSVEDRFERKLSS